jgi:hypothetical protein
VYFVWLSVFYLHFIFNIHIFILWPTIIHIFIYILFLIFCITGPATNFIFLYKSGHRFFFFCKFLHIKGWSWCLQKILYIYFFIDFIFFTSSCCCFGKIYLSTYLLELLFHFAFNSIISNFGSISSIIAQNRTFLPL